MAVSKNLPPVVSNLCIYLSFNINFETFLCQVEGFLFALKTPSSLLSGQFSWRVELELVL